MNATGYYIMQFSIEYLVFYPEEMLISRVIDIHFW